MTQRFLRRLQSLAAVVLTKSKISNMLQAKQERCCDLNRWGGAVLKKRNVLKTIILSLVFILFSAMGVSAAKYIKAGLCFGSTAVYSFTATSASGFVIGAESDGVFYQFTQLDASEIYSEQGGGHYLQSRTEYDSFASAMSEAAALRKGGAYAHAGYINGKFRVMIGLFDSADVAKSCIANVKEMSGIDFDYVYMDTKTVFAMGGGYGFVFRNENQSFCLSALYGGSVKVSGKGEYRGAIMASRTRGEAIYIINLVNMEEYIASVVGSEMYPTWNIEALKAQAVIARTYALTRTAYQSYGIDVTDDTRTQVYKGVSSETESTYKAAVETAGKVVTYNGKLAETFFCSMSGGKTADVYSAWGGGAGLDYLKSKDDIYEDVENIQSDIWQVKYTAEEVEAKLKAAGVDIGKVTGLTIAERGDDLRVRKLIISGTAGTHTLTFDKCRSFFNLRSQYYYISGGETTSKNIVSAISSSGIAEVDLNGAAVISSSGISNAPSSVTVTGANDTAIFSSGSSSVTSGEYVFDGRGNGHGVGMSQYGAQGMAKAGFTYDDIIKFYFTGVDISTYYN